MKKSAISSDSAFQLTLDKEIISKADAMDIENLNFMKKLPEGSQFSLLPTVPITTFSFSAKTLLTNI
ncbi:hypothetical protein [Chitinophaga sp. HK235]|uniref:hypothetical protein n=1 Tax=Chitinophaga sp. HK235 TaxID=2952571 RepID=UPI001BA78319|nr:hypothetical protein [Chitinophaga sp. HK235]